MISDAEEFCTPFIEKKKKTFLEYIKRIQREWKRVILILTIIQCSVYGFYMPETTDHSLKDYIIVSVWSECPQQAKNGSYAG